MASLFVARRAAIKSRSVLPRFLSVSFPICRTSFKSRCMSLALPPDPAIQFWQPGLVNVPIGASLSRKIIFSGPCSLSNTGRSRDRHTPRPNGVVTGTCHFCGDSFGARGSLPLPAASVSKYVRPRKHFGAFLFFRKNYGRNTRVKLLSFL